MSKLQSLGRAHGFKDLTRGTLFFEIKRILEAHQPAAFLLENVYNLEKHDEGRTFAVIRRSLEEELGYTFFYRVIDASGWVPQHRKRLFMVGFHLGLGVRPEDFVFPEPPGERPGLSDILEKRPPARYILGDGTWATLQRHKQRHEEAGNGFGYGLIKPPYKGKTTRTLMARYHKDGSEILVYRGKDKNPRRLTPLECARLQGFPEDFQQMFARKNGEQPVSDSQAYRQFGNSVPVPLVADIAQQLVKVLKKKLGEVECEKRKTA